MSKTRLTPRKVRFAELVASGRSQADAAREAGYSLKAPRGAGYKLMQDPRVAALVRQLQAELRQRSEITADQMIREFDEAADFAKKTENATALVRAREMKAKLAGLMVERVDARVASFAVMIGGIERGGD